MYKLVYFPDFLEMKSLNLKTWVFVPLLVWSSAASTSNYNFLKNSVISEYNDSDVDMLLEHVQIGLNGNRTVEWYNAETGHGGTVEPGEPATYKDLVCRNAIITNKSRTKQGTTSFKFCLMEDGIWKIVTED